MPALNFFREDEWTITEANTLQKLLWTRNSAGKFDADLTEPLIFRANGIDNTSDLISILDEIKQERTAVLISVRAKDPDVNPRLDAAYQRTIEFLGRWLEPQLISSDFFMDVTEPAVINQQEA